MVVLKAIIIVPETGEGKIEAIFSIEDAKGYTPDVGFKKVEVDAPGVPIDSVHWDGLAVVSGAYVSPEQAAEIIKQTDIDVKQDKIIARSTEAIDMILHFIDTVHSADLLPAWKEKLDSIRADYQAWLDAQA